MTEFLELNRLEVFWKKLKNHLSDKVIRQENVSLKESLGRITAEKLWAPEALPPFSRSTVDGFAVRAEDTAGASASLPAYLDVKGKVEMGAKTDLKLSKGEAVEMPTGGMIPQGADAVLMVEYTEYLDQNSIETTKAVATGENIVVKGEDIEKKELLFEVGHRIRPRDIGALAGLGLTKISVYREPEIAVISTGDELIEPDQEADLGEIRDINSYSISSFISAQGIEPRQVGIVKDEFDLLKESVSSNLDSDLILISGGSSVGVKDMTIDLLNSLGEPGVLLHGLSIKPGKPTILAIVDGTPVIGLPGHPASAWTVTRILLRPLLKFLLGEIGAEDIGRQDEKYQFEARLTRNLGSDRGREEYIPVRLIRDDRNRLLADPITGKSSLITTLVNGDGLIRIDTYEEGKNKGDKVVIRSIEPGIY
jgi:molybdopterin molybdotransferase